MDNPICPGCYALIVDRTGEGFLFGVITPAEYRQRMAELRDAVEERWRLVQERQGRIFINFKVNEKFKLFV